MQNNPSQWVLIELKFFSTIIGKQVQFTKYDFKWQGLKETYTNFGSIKIQNIGSMKIVKENNKILHHETPDNTCIVVHFKVTTKLS